MPRIHGPALQRVLSQFAALKDGLANVQDADVLAHLSATNDSSTSADLAAARAALEQAALEQAARANDRGAAAAARLAPPPAAVHAPPLHVRPTLANAVSTLRAQAHAAPPRPAAARPASPGPESPAHTGARGSSAPQPTAPRAVASTDAAATPPRALAGRPLNVNNGHIATHLKDAPIDVHAWVPPDGGAPWPDESRLDAFRQAAGEASDVLVAPEYFWSRSARGVSPMSAAEKDGLVHALQDISAAHPDKLIVPGTFIWKGEDGRFRNSTIALSGGECQPLTNGHGPARDGSPAATRYDKMATDYDSDHVRVPGEWDGKTIEERQPVSLPWRGGTVALDICADATDSRAPSADLSLITSSKFGRPKQLPALEGGAVIVCDAADGARAWEVTERPTMPAELQERMDAFKAALPPEVAENLGTFHATRALRTHGGDGLAAEWNALRGEARRWKEAALAGWIEPVTR